MKLHLPIFLRKTVISCMSAVVTALTSGSGSASEATYILTFNTTAVPNGGALLRLDADGYCIKTQLNGGNAPYYIGLSSAGNADPGTLPTGTAAMQQVKSADGLSWELSAQKTATNQRVYGWITRNEAGSGSLPSTSYGTSTFTVAYDGTNSYVNVDHANASASNPNAHVTMAGRQWDYAEISRSGGTLTNTTLQITGGSLDSKDWIYNYDVAAGSTLTFTGSVTLNSTVDNAGTVVFNTSANTVVTLGSGITTTQGDGFTSYTVVSGGTISGLESYDDGSLKALFNIQGVEETYAYTWSFSDGSLHATESIQLLWNQQDTLSWSADTMFGDTQYAASSVVTFDAQGEVAAEVQGAVTTTAIVVNQGTELSIRASEGASLKASEVDIQDGAVLHLSNAGGPVYVHKTTVNGILDFNVSAESVQPLQGSYSGSGSLEKSGAGILEIDSSTGSIAHDIVVREGTLKLSRGGQNGALTGAVDVYGTLEMAAGDVTGWSNSLGIKSIDVFEGGNLHISVGGNRNQTGAGLAINLQGGSITGISGANLDLGYGGATYGYSTIAALAAEGATAENPTVSTISGATLSLRQNATTISVAENARLDISSAIQQKNTYLNFEGNVPAGTNAGLTKTGAGELRLSGANTYTQATTVAEGTLSLLGGASLASSSVTVQDGAALKLDAQTGTSVSLSGALAGSGSLVKTGAGSATVGSVADSFAGSIALQGGSLTWNSTASGISQVTLGTADAATRLITAADMGVGSLTVAYAESALTLQAGTTFTAGKVTGNGTLILDGAGMLTVTGSMDVSSIALQGGSLNVRDSFLLSEGRELSVGMYDAVLESALTLGAGKLSVDASGSGAATSLNNAALTLLGGTQLQLSGGNGGVYDLFTGVGSLQTADGSAFELTEENNAIANYFDTTRPGSGFWADATLVLTVDGTLQLVRHNEMVKESLEIAEQQTGTQDYSYYKSILFNDISSCAIFGNWDSTITLSNNGSVVFVGNTAYYSSDRGGAIYGLSKSTITLSDNGSVTFSGNSARNGGVIYGESNSTITLSDNGSVEFSGNSASSAGGAIYGRGDDITLSNNGSVTFSGNSARNGGAIYVYSSSTITLSNNGSVTFSGNSASSSGGAIYVYSSSTITLSNNSSVEFSGNSASSAGGAIYGEYKGTISLSNNGSVIFSGNTASSSASAAYGGAIYGGRNLSIRNNESVLFEKNVEKSGSSYRLRSIYAGDSGDVISLSAAAGKSIEFRDSVYIYSGNTVNLNADYTYVDSEGVSVTIKQQGDILFTGKYTETHLNELLASAEAGRTATAEEILNSRTTVVEAKTNLYGGRLRVEDGAIYQGRGITAHEDSAATVRVQNATLKHSGYNLTFNSGTTLELTGNNTISGDVRMLENSTLLLNVGDTVGCTDINGNLDIAGGMTLSDSGSSSIENGVLMYVAGDLKGWTEDTWVGSSANDHVSWLGNLLVLNYNESTFNLYFNGSSSYNTRQEDKALWHHYQALTFEKCCGNDAFAFGGAIYGLSKSTITLSDNGSVVFEGNTASSHDYASGGAIHGGDNSTITLSNNGSVTFSGNTTTSSASSSSGYARGGAINGYSSSTISLSNNVSVVFEGNTASSSTDSAYGGAIYIYTEGSLHIRNNDSVEFAGNVEKRGGAYRLRSVYVEGGNGDVLNISAAAGKSVTFYDSIYVGSDATVNLNADYEDAEGNIIEQKGDIVFTGATTEDDLYKAKDNVAGTEEEIRLSRTTEVNAMTNLYGGRLRVEDGAICQGQGITAHEGSEATVRVKDATLSHSGYDLIFNAGTTLELEGANTITGNLNLMSGSSLVFENSGESGVTIHEGVLSIADDVCVDVRVDSSLWAEEYGETWDMVLMTTNATVADGSVRYKISPLGETWGYSDVAWIDGTLAISFKKGAESALWQNMSGDYRWNTRSVNWMDGKYHFSNVEGASVVLGQTGAGTITLEGAISIAGLSVEAGSSYELVLAEGASLSVSGALNVTENSQLDMGFGLSLSSVDNRGDLSLADDLTVSGAITGGGSLSVQGAVSAASLQACSFTADSLTLTEAEAQNSIGSSVTMIGAATVAGGLSIEGSLIAASLQTGSLSVDSLELTDAAAQNSIGSSVSMTGAATVAGGLNIEGSFNAASLQAGTLSADSLELTDAGAQNSIGSSVTMIGAATVAGGLSIEGSLTAASLQAGSLSADSLELTDAEAQNSIGSSVSMAGTATVAGGLNIEGSFSAASLQAGSLSADSLTLTDAEAQNNIGSSVSMAGAATVAGGLNIEGSFSAASLQAGSLSVESLALTAAEAQNSIGSSVSMAGAATVAGGLNIEGSLTAASLQAGSLSADSLTLTEAGAANTVAGAVSIEGDVTVADSLTAGGALSGANVEVGGALTAASLTAMALNADSLALTAANTANTVSGDLSASSVSLATGATLEVGGVLTADEIAFSGTAKAITAGSLGADSMNFVLDRAALESLGIGYRQSAAIVSADTAMGNGFAVTLNGDSAPVVAAAYAYTIGVNGGAVQLAADYAYDGMQVWYRGGWVGDSSWTDYFIAGFDAVEGKETVDLGGAAVTGSNLFIAYEEGVTSSTMQNGSLNFEYIDMGGGQFELGEGAAATTDELYGKGETLVMHEDSTLDVTKLTLGTLALEAGTITVKDATLNTISGTEGTLNIASGGKVTVKSDVTLTGLNNEGSLSLGQKKLTVNALVDVGGNVTAGEVTVQSRGSRMASFDKLVADKVTVANSMNVGRYTDDLSVGDGSVIGELVAETLEVRGGTVTLGRSSGCTEMSLLNLDLQEDATLVLNQQTALAVTDTLTATENATVQLKKDASICYGDTSISNRNESGTVDVNAYALSGETELELNGAHVAATGSEDKVIDYKLVNSTVENAGTGTLQLTHAGNSLTSIAATSGSVEVYNQAELNLAHLSIGRNQSLAVMSSDVAAGVDEEFEARVNIFGSATFGADSTLIADLAIQSGATIRIEGVVHMGSSITLSSGMVLAGAALENALSLNVAGDYVVLFDGVDSLILDGETPLVYSPGGLTVDDKVLASKYFMGLEEMENLYITFEENSDSESGNSSGGEVRLTLGSEVIPEPTTSTLSLLALAALAARRRRK